jgi:hypothetical protein
MPELTREVLDRLRYCSMAVKAVVYGPVDDVMPRWSKVIAEFSALEDALDGRYYERAEEWFANDDQVNHPQMSRAKNLDELFVLLFVHFLFMRRDLAWLANFATSADDTADAILHIRTLGGEGPLHE